MLQGIQPAQFENVINLLANELASFSDPFVLVLDDFHVIHIEAVNKIIAYLLEHQAASNAPGTPHPDRSFAATFPPASSRPLPISGQTNCALHKMKLPLS